MVPGPIIIISVVIIMCAVCAETRRDCHSHHHWYEIGFYTTSGEANAFVSADRECRRHQLKNHIHKQTANSAAASIPVWDNTMQLQSSIKPCTVPNINSKSWKI